MRLHHLSLTAFGPFAGTETVDFDALNDAGLFLLSGATGAGKTSILDAVCFALYGAVPGVRGVKALRSQHADDQTAPEVVLDFSVRDRTFRVRRSPEWNRPKRRGTGTVTEKASASMIETTGGSEHFLTSRAAEVGLMISELIGMRAAQFQQVAMLPQGDFQRFLHASSQERHDVLQHLFQTDRFARIEEWVNDHSRSLHRRAQGGETEVRRLLHTFAERAEVTLPETLSDDASAATLTDDAVLAWAGGELAAARASLAAAREAHTETEARRVEAHRRLAEQRRTADLVRRRDEAQARVAALEDSAAEAEAHARRLDAHGRAAACLPVLTLLDRAEAELAVAGRAREEAVSALAGLALPGDVDPLVAGADEAGAQALDGEALEAAERRTRRLVTQVEALLPRAELLRATTAGLAGTVDELDRAERQREQVEQSRGALPARLAQARADVAATTALAARVEALALQAEAAADRAEAAASVRSAETELAGHQATVRDRRDAAADARETVQDLAARRLAGIAAELAGRLAEGEPCVVCGSEEHPAPAADGSAPVTQAEQESADAAYDAAQEALLAANEAAGAAQHRLEGLRVRAQGLPAHEAAARLREVQEQQAVADDAAARLPAESARVTAVEEEATRLAEEAANLDTSLATLRQRRDSEQELVLQITAEIAGAVGEDAADDLPGLLRRLSSVVQRLADARSALLAHDQAVERARDLAGQCADTATAHGFGTVEEVRAAVLVETERAGLEHAVAERTEHATAARATLADPDILATGDADGPDLAAQEALAGAADTAAAEASRAYHLLDQRVTALDGLLQRASVALDAWAPVRAEYLRADSMSRLVRGMGSDNQLQMRLSAYVLATRLDQVLDAANERLSHMRDQRYLLQRTGRATRKGAQAGLGLEVVDQWTGDVREPSTLSGGETFVVSLSLALGLADVVTQEAGGTEIETLFVDEGFGTLDADTLDDVMDRLDGLRAGGRTVGVVSHVTELRTRIPAQLHVRKSPRGSSIHAETLVG